MSREKKSPTLAVGNQRFARDVLTEWRCWAAGTGKARTPTVICTTLASKTAQEASKIASRQPKRPKTAQEGPLDCQGSQRLPLSWPKIVSDGLQDCPREFQDGPKALHEGPKTARKASKTASDVVRRAKSALRLPKRPQEAPKRPPGGPQEAPKRSPDPPNTPPRGPRRPPKCPRERKQVPAML